MKILSLTFDDGFLNTAYKVDGLNYKATFYIVTGWVRPNNTPIVDAWNKGINHGSLEDWIDLSKRGHDIQSHTVSHHSLDWYKKASEAEIAYEYNEAINFLKQIHRGPYTIATPYHHIPRIPHMYKAVRLGSEHGIFNSLSNLNLNALNSYGAKKNVARWALNNLPDNNDIWVLACLHGLDGEGYLPWTSGELQQFCELALSKGYKIQTVNDVLYKKCLI